MTQTVLTISFNLLLFFTPLFFTPLNQELFEYNKMILVYLLTIVIATAWFIKMLNLKQLLIKRTPLDIPILVFLLSQILSGVFSIDPHTSWWGYYSRSNGGIFSIISYIMLYYAFVSNFKSEEVTKFIKWAVFGGLAVSLWAIPEHFGYSPSCKILVDRWAADCWVQDVQARVFASLGQPNWLAAYLAMIIFPAMYFFLTTKSVIQRFFYFFTLAAMYTAFTFSFSRGGLLGFIAGMGVFTVFSTVKITHLRSFLNLITFNLLQSENQKDSKKDLDIKIRVFPLQLLGIILISFVLINIMFGSALTGDFRLIRQAAPPPRPTLATVTQGTQLENGGTESGQIRLIVWKGALDIFKAYPVLGSGVETFAYSYYQFRPKEHNNVSEWDFLYNKAHNEYLNYLATTGSIGFLSYVAMILAFCIWTLRKITSHNYADPEHQARLILISGLFSGYVSYLVQNVFGFSVVMIALLFFIFPSFAIASTNDGKFLSFTKIPLWLQIPYTVIRIIYKRNFYQKIATLIILLTGGYLLMSVFNVWRADVNYKVGSDYQDAGNPGRAYNSLLRAVVLNPDEPLYQSDLGNAASSASLALMETDSTRSAELKEEAVLFTQSALSKSPYNVSLWRTAIRTYYELSLLDPELEAEMLKIVDNTINLAPTDPKLYYNKALILSQINKNSDAVTAMKQSIDLKPDYREARLSLADFLIVEGQTEAAKEQLNIVLEQIPNDPDALQKLKDADEEKPAL